MKLVITYCSRPKAKDPGGLPAIERYDSQRIRDLAEMDDLDDGFFLILSGEFALLEAEEYIPWYDHLLTPDEVPEMAVTVADQLLEYEPEEVVYHTADPAAYPEVQSYFAVMEKACRFAGVPMTTVFLEGNPE
jgi:hypothetical protein|nr:hypothetical protein [Candidatus Krumholzibacteria bacterium]